MVHGTLPLTIVVVLNLLHEVKVNCLWSHGESSHGVLHQVFPDHWGLCSQWLDIWRLL